MEPTYRRAARRLPRAAQQAGPRPARPARLGLMDSPPRAARWPRLLLAAGAPLLLVVFFTIPLGSFGPEHPALSWTVLALLLTALAGLLLREIQLLMVGSRRGRPGLGIPLLSLVALLVFAAAYLSLARDPGEFKGLSTRIDALYFTVVTMSTVGYGDIAPLGQSARVVVMLQILYTLVFLTAGATAVGQYLRGRLGDRARQRHPGGPADEHQPDEHRPKEHGPG
ncbi:potassium channel family protein [Kitasatospora sp. NBC_01250]|uniref:potassium channel family protein n=1 Tax=Kitasatospora sp. NBC_01250 TaxID=2903571 RepID=UPI002E3805B3|nr:potassium channel family protein [Kitasatospora sp. NBC_01250]